MKKEDSSLLHRSAGDPALAIGGAARTREKIRDTISTYCQLFSALGSRSNRFSIRYYIWLRIRGSVLINGASLLDAPLTITSIYRNRCFFA